MKIKQYLLNEAGIATQKDMTGHAHLGDVNEDGDGKTVECLGCEQDHVHKIYQWLVQPADGHTHNLKD